MKQRIPNQKILCCASIFALSLAACLHHGGKIKSDANLADNASTASANHFNKLKKGHRTKRLSGQFPDPRSYDNLWDRLFDRFDLPEISHQDVDRELNWFINHPNYIERVQSRAEPFLYSIVKQLEKHNMPGELALLPVIESAFQPHVVSSAHAAGIWQFIPATGRHYGLKQSHSYDGRRDIYASTRAAIKYLKKLHNDFNGDWLLAIAGYNCGEGAVSRAIQRNNARGLPTDFWSLDLPQETRSYVPRLLAVAKLFSEADQYGVSLHPIPNQALYKTVKMNSQVDLALAANAADISLDRLFELNPGFKRQHVDVDGSYRLFIPAHKKIADFKEELARQIAGQETFYERDAQTASAPQEAVEASTVPSAEAQTPALAMASPPTTTALAEEPEKAQVEKPAQEEIVIKEPAAQIAEIETAKITNPTTDDTPQINPAEPPLQLAQIEPNELSVSDNMNNARDYEEPAVTNARERERVKSSGKSTRKAHDEPSPVLQPKAMEREPSAPANRYEPASVRRGQKYGQKNRDESPVQPRQSEPDNSGKKTAYVIREGDTVYSIARKYDMDVEDLKKMNRLARADDIKWGQSVVVWNKDAGKKPSPARSGAGFSPSQPIRYTAHDGETLFSISRRFNVTVADLRKWNGIKEDKQFRAGMNIKVAENKD